MAGISNMPDTSDMFDMFDETAEKKHSKTNEQTQEPSTFFYKLIKNGIYRELHQRSLLTDAQLNELLNK